MSLGHHSLARQFFLGGVGGGAVPEVPDVPHYTSNGYRNIALQYALQEPDSSTSGVDDGPGGHDWTAAGDAVITSNAAVMDGNGDYLDPGAAAHIFNWLHDGTPFTLQAFVLGRQANANNTILGNEGIASASRGGYFGTTSDGRVRLQLAKGASGDPILDWASAVVIPLDSNWHELVVEYDPQNGTDLLDAVRLGVDGTVVEEADLPDSLSMSIAVDASAAVRVGRAGTATGQYFNGTMGPLRVWKDHLHFGLKGEATYTQDTDPTAWVTAEAGSGFSAFPPRFFPKEETVAGGSGVGGMYYHAEPRFVNCGGGVVLAFRMEGPSHNLNTTMKIVRYRSTDYGFTFPASTRVVVATDASFACRNLAVGRDPVSGRIAVMFRTANGSDVTQDTWVTTSTNEGASWTTPASVASSLTGADIPFGNIIPTAKGYQATFYAVDFAEALFSADMTSWGDRTTIYDVTGSSPSYHEPSAVAVNANNIIVAARKHDGSNNKHAYFSSIDGADTWSFIGEASYSGSSFGRATPLDLFNIGNNKIGALWGERGGDYPVQFATMESAPFLANPRAISDGTAARTVIREMRHNSGWGNVSTAEYGYATGCALDSERLIAGWYEAIVNNGDVTRTYHTGIDLAA